MSRMTHVRSKYNQSPAGFSISFFECAFQPLLSSYYDYDEYEAFNSKVLPP